jgi:hypothetical protein
MTPSLTEEMVFIKSNAEYGVEVALTLLRGLKEYS